MIKFNIQKGRFIMKKLIKVMSLVLCLSLLISCGTEKLSDKYNEEEIKGVSEQIINNLNHNNALQKEQDRHLCRCCSFCIVIFWLRVCDISNGRTIVRN